jgi:hypothetical protein
MKSTQRLGTRNIDRDGVTHPPSTKGIASPRSSKEVKEAEGVIKGNPKKAAEGFMEHRRGR